MIAMAMRPAPQRQDLLQTCALVGAALGVAWLVKDFYARARADDLLWILAPTTHLVEWITGTAFEFEAHRGFVSRELRYEIVPACAGVNFMVVAFVSLVCGLAHTQTTPRARGTFFALAGVAAYATTLLANTTRLALAIAIHEAGIPPGPLTPEQLHCAVGVAVYLFFLCVLFTLGARAAGAKDELAPA